MNAALGLGAFTMTKQDRMEQTKYIKNVTYLPSFETPAQVTRGYSVEAYQESGSGSSIQVTQQ